MAEPAGASSATTSTVMSRDRLRMSEGDYRNDARRARLFLSSQHHATSHVAAREIASSPWSAPVPIEIAPDDIVQTAAEGEANERPPLLVLDPLTEFLDEHGLGSGELQVEPVGDGHSNVTYAVTRGDTEIVVRRPPRPPLPPSAHDVLREARVLKALEGKARVPKVLAVSEGGVIGCPFYVMERVQGHVITTAVPPEF